MSRTVTDTPVPAAEADGLAAARASLATDLSAPGIP
jgi:hypothetical protein